MRSLVLVFVVAAFASGETLDLLSFQASAFGLGQTRLFESQINRTSECTKHVLNKGNPSIGLPSFDPLYLRDHTVNLDAWEIIGLSGKIVLKDFVIRNAANWVLSHIEATLQHPGYRVNTVADWPNAEFEGGYNLEIDLLSYKITGSGKISIVITDYSHGTNQVFQLPIHISEMKTAIKMGDLKFHVEQVLVDGEDVSALINDKANKGAEWVNQNSEKIGTIYSTIVMAFINNIGYTKNLNVYGMGEIITELLKCLN